jgi:hypothetical protein
LRETDSAKVLIFLREINVLADFAGGITIGAI